MSQQQPQTILRDYQHAARIYTDSNFRLSPKYGFLFYVEFDFNPLITQVSNQAAQELGMIVKSVSLPKFTIDAKVHNAYNRKNIVQNKINYDPVTISFRDDQADNVKQFWYDYYSYFYRDPDYADATYAAQHKYQSRPTLDWGYSPRPAVGYNNANGTQPYQYIQAIRIYSLYQGNFSEYQLVNPLITSFKHGDHDVSVNEFLHTDMTVQYETVKYLEGKVTQNTAGGFIDLHYDTKPSPSASVPQSQTNSSQITDLANAQTAIMPMMRTDAALNAASINPSSSIPALLNQVTLGASAGVGGGYSIPSLGSLTQGVTGSALMSQQLRAAGIGLAGSATSQLASGVMGGIAAGLGPQGTSIVGMAASAIANPNQALKTVENMATALVLGVGMNLLNQGIASAVQGISGTIATGIDTGLKNLNTGLAFGDTPGATLTGQVGSLLSPVGTAWTNLTTPNSLLNLQQNTPFAVRDWSGSIVGGSSVGNNYVAPNIEE
jgi:hypothetical protein